MKQKLIAAAILIYIIVAFSSAFGQSTSTQNRHIYSYQNIHQNHPDGTVGKLSLHLRSSYLSIKNQPGQPVVDAQKFQAGIGWVINNNFYERQSFTIRKEFVTEYQLSFGFSYYLSNPLQESVEINPDGKIGSPVLSIDAILLLDNLEETKSHTNFKSKILFPFSHSLSIFTGYTVYDEITSIDNEQFFGGVHIYISRYSHTSKFDNPDSPLSGMAISLSGGSSEFGNFGKIEFSLPSSQSVTVNVSARGDFLEAPNNKIYTGSLQLIYYSGK